MTDNGIKGDPINIGSAADAGTTIKVDDTPAQTTAPAPANDTSAMKALQDQINALEAGNLKRDAEFQAVLAHKDKLLGEKKAEQEKARVALEEKLTSKGDAESFKQLLDSAKKELADSNAKWQSITDKIGQEKLQSAALKAAALLSDGPNVDMMADQVIKRLKDVDGTVTVTSETGEATISSIDDLVKEFRGNDKYKSLLRGTSASGGNATGTDGTVTQATSITDVDFYKLDEFERMKRLNAGITVENTQRRVILPHKQ